MTERFHIEALAEFFNVFNHSNYDGFNDTIYTAAATTNTTPLATPVMLTPTRRTIWAKLPIAVRRMGHIRGVCS